MTGSTYQKGKRRVSAALVRMENLQGEPTIRNILLAVSVEVFNMELTNSIWSVLLLCLWQFFVLVLMTTRKL